MKKKFSIVVVNFFRVTNPYSGASEVSWNFFKSIQCKDKKLFQFSDKSLNIKEVKTLKAKTKIHKIFKLKYLSDLISDFCKKKENPIIIIEGASWVGYTFVLFYFLKNRLNNAKFIYHSHNIEYLLRKKKGNFLITILTKFFENYIGKNFDIFTAVSKIDKLKLKKLYNINAKILPNGINFPIIEKVKESKFKFKYIFFCGSIDYLPNKEALEILINKIMPIVNKIDPNLKLLVSGNKKIEYKSKYLLNVGFVNKKKFYRILKGASVFVNPMKTAFGSQVKMITALVFGKTIIASKKATLGLTLNHKYRNLLISNNDKNFANLILKNINAKKINIASSKYYKDIYLVKNITSNFFKKI